MKRFALVLAAALSLAACGPDKQAIADNLTASKTFLAANDKQKGVQTLADGLQYKVLKTGAPDGVRPQKMDEVKVHYEGRLLSADGKVEGGKVFDSSYDRGAPASMPLAALIPAWQEALTLMRPGDVWMLYVPPELGYGEEGAGGGEIPPNSVLIFKIELLGVLPGPGHSANG